MAAAEHRLDRVGKRDRILDDLRPVEHAARRIADAGGCRCRDGGSCARAERLRQAEREQRVGESLHPACAQAET